jgi:hypothetical protein
MRHSSLSHSVPSGARERVLLVSDWDLDPQAVVGAARREHRAAGLYLLVPARLHGIDWVGDPYASVPCAQRQLDAIVRLAPAAGLDVVDGRIGDPEQIAAIDDALADWPVQALLLCAPRGRVGAPYPFDLWTRARRLSSLPVARIELPTAATWRERHGLLRLRGHCPVEQRRAA